MDQKIRDTEYATTMEYQGQAPGMVDQRIRDVEYAKTMEYQGRAPLDLTEPMLEAELMEADNVMAAETRSTGYHYRHYDKFTGEWERRWAASPQCQGVINTLTARSMAMAACSTI
jgi:hypothetical protein